MTQNPEAQMTDQDIEDLKKLTEEEPHRTLLESWQKLLGSIEAGQSDRISPRMAMKALGAWPNLQMEDVPEYFFQYHEYLKDIRNALTIEIESDGKALQQNESREQDAEENRAHYLNLLLQWQLAALQWEHDWDITAPQAYAKVAAMGDAHAFVLGPEGMVAHLGDINFQMTEGDQLLLAEALTEFEEGERE